MTQIREEAYFTKGRVIVRGKTVKGGAAKKADYILSYKIQKVVEEKIKALGVGHDFRRERGPLAKALKKEFEDVFDRGQPYWDVVAANVIEKTRNIASVAIMAQGGVAAYRIEAVIDHRRGCFFDQLLAWQSGGLLHSLRGQGAGQAGRPG